LGDRVDVLHHAGLQLKGAAEERTEAFGRIIEMRVPEAVGTANAMARNIRSLQWLPRRALPAPALRD